MKNIIITIFILLLFSSLVSAADEIVFKADKINYDSSTTHTVTILNAGTLDTNVTFALPTGFTFVSGSGCTNPTGQIACEITAGSSSTFIVTSAGTQDYYTITQFTPTMNNSYTASNTLQFIRIEEQEIFHTLVEYGRGRGNYFYDSFGTNLSGSGHTGSGCPYLPNGSIFELNYLHKVLNIKQYFGFATAKAYNASFTCTYPNSTVVRVHLVTDIDRSGELWLVNYTISEISGSWERMGYLGQDFDAGEFTTGSSFTINCTNMVYQLDEAGGNVTVNESSFTLEIRDREPFTVTSYATSPLLNGTQELEITYIITNNEVYTVNDIVAEILAPDYGTFIGVRGELWGTSLNTYRYETPELAPGESVNITLVVRFNTTGLPDFTTLNTSKGTKIQYVTCWESNAYNPAEYVQLAPVVGNLTVNMAATSQIVNIPELLQNLYNIIYEINITTKEINNTVSIIYNVTQSINDTVTRINETVFSINLTINEILNYTIAMNGNLSYIIDLLNCNGTDDTPICNLFADLNQSLNFLINITNEINLTVTNINNTVNTFTGRFDAIDGNITEIDNTLIQILSLVNCSSNPDSPICLYLNNTNMTLWEMYEVINNTYYIATYINETRWGNYTAQDIIDAINGTGSDTATILERIERLEEFNQELVFLVTDSFGLQQSAMRDVRNNDLDSASEKLRQANARLDQATTKLIEITQEKQNSTTIVSYIEDKSWVFPFLIALALIAAGMFLFSKVPEDEYKQR